MPFNSCLSLNFCADRLTVGRAFGAGRIALVVAVGSTSAGIQRNRLGVRVWPRVVAAPGFARSEALERLAAAVSRVVLWQGIGLAVCAVSGFIGAFSHADRFYGAVRLFFRVERLSESVRPILGLQNLLLPSNPSGPIRQVYL